MTVDLRKAWVPGLLLIVLLCVVPVKYLPEQCFQVLILRQESYWCLYCFILIMNPAFHPDKPDLLVHLFVAELILQRLLMENQE